MNTLLDSKRKIIGAAAVCIIVTLTVTLAFAGGSSSELSRSGMHHLEHMVLTTLNENTPISGDTLIDQSCLQRIFIGNHTDGVNNSNLLNCTASDIAIAHAIEVFPDSCVEGTYFKLKAKFKVNVNAKDRYDEVFVFRADGGDNARGDGSTAAGVCSLSTLNPLGKPGLDRDGDMCGDLNGGSYEVVFDIDKVLCNDSDGDGWLNLPNCTSWHSNQATLCDTSKAFTFHPETKSKCRCDDKFQVPVEVQAEGVVVKVAEKAVVTYSVEVINTSGTEVAVTSLVDNKHGDLCAGIHGSIVANDCGAKVCCVGLDCDGSKKIAQHDSLSCRFDVRHHHPGTKGAYNSAVTAELTSTKSPSNKSDAAGSTTINLNLDAP